MPRLRSLILTAAVVSFALPLAAQEHLQMQSANPYGTVVAWGTYVGPYRAQVLSQPGMPTIDVYCVDYLNHISIGQQWYANFSKLDGSLGNTRNAWYGGGGYNEAAARIRYQKAAWLASQFDKTSQSQWGGIHAAIWQLTTPGYPSGSYSSASPWINLANTNYGSVNLSEWSVVTDVNTYQGVGGVQEYLVHTVVPEPLTIALVGTGLAGIGMARRRRRKTSLTDDA